MSIVAENAGLAQVSGLGAVPVPPITPEDVARAATRAGRLLGALLGKGGAK